MLDENMEDIKESLKKILTHELLLAVYNLIYPWIKIQLPSGATVGGFHFQPSQEYMQSFYELIFHDTLLPLSKIPFESLLAFDSTKFLPDPTTSDYPEQCVGLITVLDQTRIVCTGYNLRYTRAFFDPIAEKLARQLIALPVDLRPDGKQV